MDKLNNTYQEIWDKIKEHNQITIATHLWPDGDTIATALALKELILINLPNKVVKISGDKYPRPLLWMEKNDEVSDEYFNNSLVIVVDTSTKSRIFDPRVVTKEAIKIDHHHHEGEWLLQIGGDHWPATGELLAKMIQALKLKVNAKIEEAIFVAIWTDTEGLTQRNITKQTHEVLNNLKIDKKAILQKMALTKDEQAIIDSSTIKVIGKVTKSIASQSLPNDFYRAYVNGVYNKSETEVVIVITNQGDYHRVSLRSKGDVDVSYYASKYGGGGHFASAGFTINNKDDVEQIINDLIKEINE